MQDFFQIDFLNGFNDDGQNTSYLSRRHLIDMLERTGALVDVDCIFDEAGLYGDDDTLIAFEEFMRIFRRLRFEAIHDLLNSNNFSSDSMRKESAVAIEETADFYAEQITAETEENDIVTNFRLSHRLGGTENVVFALTERDEMKDLKDFTRDRNGARFVQKVFRFCRFDEVVGKQMQQELIHKFTLLKSMNHVGIMRIHEVSEHFSHVHIISDMYIGGNLGERLPYPEREVVRIMKQILSALAHLHSKHMVHGNLSLESVVFESEDEDSAIKLVGFGLARNDPQEEAGNLRWRKLYARSPECLGEGLHTKECDMWALGVIAYIMLSGYLPFNPR